MIRFNEAAPEGFTTLLTLVRLSYFQLHHEEFNFVLTPIVQISRGWAEFGKSDREG
jgi:hypothetical protein